MKKALKNKMIYLYMLISLIGWAGCNITYIKVKNSKDTKIMKSDTLKMQIHDEKKIYNRNRVYH